MASVLSADDRRSLFALAGLLALCFAVAALGSAVTLPAIPGWYSALRKPFFTPPNWMFGPVWTILYLLMAIAAWRIWRCVGDRAARTLALRFFAAQLALNLAWPFTFFGARSPALGLIVIVALEAAIVLTIRAFARLDRPAAWMMAPYAIWVAYAAAVNLAVVTLN
ncbi:MAG: tryptophan-rich sensory protein [Rhizobiales bacterium]|nr:tryptophan-rich sensory protein [Hyphomicrobiales bacterium]